MARAVAGLLLSAVFVAGAAAADLSTCESCHTPPYGPPLQGVAGRKIAGVPGIEYCAALTAKSGEAWTDTNLKAMLTDAKAFAPGCTMDTRLPPAEADAIIAALKNLH